MRKALEPNEAAFRRGKNVYLPPSTATVQLVSELATGRHERKKLLEAAHKIQGNVRNFVLHYIQYEVQLRNPYLRNFFAKSGNDS